jgi:carbonic anhydrase
MDKLITGIQQFQRTVLKNRAPLFQKLASAQSPEVLFITCSDSRIDPNLLTQTEP